jgi:hypothetical protein
MKIFRFFFLLLLLWTSKQSFGAAAPASTVVWEISLSASADGSAGASTNGGFFNPGNANFVSNFTATSATGTAPVISSASYNFVAGDVGAWIYVKSGTNWLPGYYKVSSVASNAATVDATIGHAYNMVNGVATASTVAGVASTASPTAGTCGVDYSRLGTTPKLTRTDLVSVGSSTTMTSAGALFTPVMVGNALQITNAGTGGFGLVGWYEIVSYNSTSSVVTDSTTNNGTAMAAGTGQIGGSIDIPATIGTNTAGKCPSAGNYVWLNGTITRGATDTLAASGSSTAPIKYIGYGTYRGDGYQGLNTNGATKLVTTNMPAITYSSTFHMAPTGSWFIVENLNIAGSINSNLLTCGAGTDSAVVNCLVSNSSTGASAEALQLGTRDIAFNNDLNMTGASGGTCVVECTSNGERVIGNRVKAVSATCPGILYAANEVILFNTLFTNGFVAIQSNSTTTAEVIGFNTVVSSASDNINVKTGNTQLNLIIGNMSTDATGYGLNAVATGNAVFTAYNRYRNNNSAGAQTNSGTGWLNATSYGEVALNVASGASSVDYNSPGSTNFDYSLKTTGPAANAALPPKASVGALQLNATTTAAQRSYNSAN